MDTPTFWVYFRAFGVHIWGQVSRYLTMQLIMISRLAHTISNDSGMLYKNI